jgi:hypothetical protein
MSQVVGDIAVSVGADIGPLQRDMRRAGGVLRGFEGDSRRMAAAFARNAVRVTGAIAGITTGLVVMTAKASAFGTEVRNLSKLAGVGTTEFQRLAAAAGTVGISQEKLADILKDVNDRIGDFMNTGGGPMKDFFENIAPLVGVTADQFARLSGPEALQLYVSSLEKAGASQAEMTFYMEALASDATALVPLMREGGRAMRELGDDAEATGRVLDENTIAAAERLDQTLYVLKQQIRTETISALIALEDELVILADFFTENVIPAIQGTVNGLAMMAEWATKVKGLMAFLRDPSGVAGGHVGDTLNDRYGITEPGDAPEYEGPEGGLVYDEDGNLVVNPDNPNRLKIIVPTGTGNTPPDRPGKPGRTSGGRGRDFAEEFERLRDQFATEQEIIAENYEQQMEQLREFRERKLATEEEFNELERRIQKDHGESLADLERKRQDAMLSAWAGALGDLASLMQSENKKLFAIGKAAAIAQATIEGFQAAVSAWNVGMRTGGPPVAAAFTAMSLAKTGMLISNIASQSANGSGGGAASGGGGATAQAAPQVSNRTTYDLHMRGEIFDRSQVVSLINKINEAQEDGAIVRLV